MAQYGVFHRGGSVVGGKEPRFSFGERVLDPADCAEVKETYGALVKREAEYFCKGICSADGIVENVLSRVLGVLENGEWTHLLQVVQYVRFFIILAVGKEAFLNGIFNGYNRKEFLKKDVDVIVSELRRAFMETVASPEFCAEGACFVDEMRKSVKLPSLLVRRKFKAVSALAEEECDDSIEDAVKVKPEDKGSGVGCTDLKERSISEKANSLAQKAFGFDVALDRNWKLMRAVRILPGSEVGRAKVLEVTKKMLKTRIPAGFLNVEGVEEDRLSYSQINDTATNFIFWALDNVFKKGGGLKDRERRFSDVHKFVLYLAIFRGISFEKICEYCKWISAKNERNKEKLEKRGVFSEIPAEIRDLTPEKAEEIYEEVRAFVEEDGGVTMRKFLRDVGSGVDRGWLRQMEGVSRLRNSYTDVRGLENVAELGMVGFGEIPYPKNDFESEVLCTDVVCMQAGSLVARRKVLTSVTRLIAKYALRKHNEDEEYSDGVPEESIDIAQEVWRGVFRVLSRIDPFKSKPSTYIAWWIDQVGGRYFMEKGLVRDPVYFYSIVKFFRKNPDATDEEARRELKSYGSRRDQARIGDDILMDARKRARGEKGLDYIDSVAGDKGTNDRGAMVRELTVGFFDNDEDARIDSTIKGKADRISPYLSERDKVVLEKKIVGLQTLEEVGTVLGVTRERVRQLERDILEMLVPFGQVGGSKKPSSRKIKGVDLFSRTFKRIEGGGNVMVVVEDPAAFESWIEKNVPEDLRAAFKIYLSVDISGGASLFKLFDRIKDCVGDGEGAQIGVVKKRLRAVYATLCAQLERVEEEERFVHIFFGEEYSRRVRAQFNSLLDLNLDE
ncbi:MAG: sigma factor-like helix-turn-helix DNA-binding protein [Candidatus Gracilibacteria bacterium]|jgi:RNA polymerase sigma factor (sigma-70 family)